MDYVGDLNLETGNVYTLKIDDTENHHIKEVIPFTGNDDYEITDAVRVKSQNNKLLIKTFPEKDLIKLKGHRIRGEICASVIIYDEPTQKEFEIMITHHKGNVYLSVKDA